MGLKNLVIASETVEIPGNDPLVVRGLGLDSIIFLVRHHEDVVRDLFMKAQAGQLDGSSVESVVGMLADRAGPLAWMIIACGCGEPEEWQMAKALPLDVQIEAIDKIVRLTFAGENALEKMLETVARMMSGAADLQISKS
jgi:hypothetical protein